MSDLLEVTALDNATRDDDPHGGPPPIAYIGVPFLTFAAVAFAGLTLLGLALCAIGAAASTVALRWARTNSLHRARAEYFTALVWLDGLIGTNEAVSCANSVVGTDGSFPQFVSDWRRIDRLTADTDVTAELFRLAEDHSLAYAVLTECWPRTANGWTTDDHVCDVTPTVLRRLAANGQADAPSYRAALRAELAGVR